MKPTSVAGVVKTFGHGAVKLLCQQRRPEILMCRCDVLSTLEF